MPTIPTSSALPSTTLTDCSTTPPYLVCYIQTSRERLYHVSGKGFVTQELHRATRHPVDPGRNWLALDGPFERCDIIHCIAPLFITSVAESHVEVSWGNRRLHLSADDLVVQAGRLVWREVKHLHRHGHPLGPIIQLAHEGHGPAFAYFNIEILPLPGQTGFLHPAPDDWDSTPRGIQTHLGLLGFSILHPGGNTGNPTIWCRPLKGYDGLIRLETGTGTRVAALVVEFADQPARKIVGFDQSGTHRNLHRQLLALIEAIELLDPSPDLQAVVASLFSVHRQIPAQPCS